jgi:hypothetical protein
MAGWNSSWTSGLLPNACLWTILETFKEKESWSSLLFKQHTLAVGRGSTGAFMIPEIFLYRRTGKADDFRFFSQIN